MFWNIHLFILRLGSTNSTSHPRNLHLHYNPPQSGSTCEQLQPPVWRHRCIPASGQSWWAPCTGGRTATWWLRQGHTARTKPQTSTLARQPVEMRRGSIVRMRNEFRWLKKGGEGQGKGRRRRRKMRKIRVREDWWNENRGRRIEGNK